MKQICALLVVMLMFSLVVVAVGCSAKTAKFEVSSLDVSPDICFPGDTVLVSAVIANDGGAMGEYIAQLSVNDVVGQTQTLTLEPGSSQTLSFTLNKGEPDGYVVQLGEFMDSFTVLGVSNLSVLPGEVEPDQPVIVGADLQNAAETEAIYHCCLLCQGKEVEAKDITVPGGSIETVTFTLSQSTPGVYEVELLGLVGSFRVLKPADFEITGLRIHPNPAKVGAEATISIQIKNYGEAEGTYNATMLVDGLVEETMDIALAGGTLTSASFLVSKDSPGNYDCEIGDEQAILKVIQPVRLSTGTFLVRELSDGQSKLRVRNETDLDAVVVLSSPEEPEIALLAVYIQSDDSYTVTRIPRGTCIMHVAFGKDWDADSQKFLTNATYEQLEDEFDFAQSEHTYTKFTVTLSGKDGEPIQSQVIRQRTDGGQSKSGGCGCS